MAMVREWVSAMISVEAVVREWVSAMINVGVVVSVVCARTLRGFLCMFF